MSKTDSKFNWLPNEALVSASNLTAFLKQVGLPDYEALVQRADADPERFWGAVMRFFDARFYKPYERVVDLSRGIAWPKWCPGGTTNIVLNCIDKHRGTPTYDQVLIAWEGEDGAVRHLSYRQFDAEVGKLAAALNRLGVGKGDVVALYMPNLPETFVAFFAIAKVGAIIMPLFSGFGPQPLVRRLTDGGAKAVITADGTWRRGTPGAMKPLLDEALAEVPSVEHVIVVRRMGDRLDTPMRAGRDHWWADLLAAVADTSVPTAEMAADDPAVLLFTSGTTGKPKGTIWTHVGATAKLAVDLGLCGDFKAGDRFFFMSDMGWAMGSMCAIVPAFLGGSLLVAEGAPDYPDTGRFWRLAQDHAVTILGVAPTLVRGMMRYGDEAVEQYDFSKVRLTISGGEAWTDTPWLWFFKHVCKEKVPIINVSGGTEIGCSIVTGTVHHPLKPGSFGGPVPGMGADIVDDSGKPVPPGQVGELVLKQASIGMTKSLWKDDERYLDSYWNIIPGMWVHGDFAMRDEDGLYYILGRSDDTIKVSGKRTGPSELEGLLMATGKVSEAAVIGVPDPVKGSAIVCVCVPMPGVVADGALEALLSRAVESGMGASYRPRQVVFVDDLPKTRNMKVMRRVVRSVFRGDNPGDLSSLVNPETVLELQQKVTASPQGR